MLGGVRSFEKEKTQKEIRNQLPSDDAKRKEMKQEPSRIGPKSMRNLKKSPRDKKDSDWRDSTSAQPRGKTQTVGAANRKRLKKKHAADDKHLQNRR